jgi:enoyl-CoA hydratase/carnithine racemase
MSEHAWVQFPFANLGIAAELGSTYFLARLLGFQKAKEILFFPERISAKSALELGLCSRVVTHDELLAYTRSQAEKLIPPGGASQAIRAMKHCMHEPRVAELSAALDLENEALSKLFPAPDFAEALAARMERRPPVFTGKAS